MEILISMIEDVVAKLLQYDTEGYARAAEELADSLVEGFSKIVTFYADPKMTDHFEDAKYWPGQLERIMNALSTGDDFATVDVLYNETRANLLELNGILKDRGIL